MLLLVYQDLGATQPNMLSTNGALADRIGARHWHGGTPQRDRDGVPLTWEEISSSFSCRQYSGNSYRYYSTFVLIRRVRSETIIFV